MTNDSEEWRLSAANWSVYGQQYRPDCGPYPTKQEAREAAQSYYNNARSKVQCRGGKIVAVTLSCPGRKPEEVFLNP